MSYIPLRDRYTFPGDINDRLMALSDLADADAQAANHKDSCGCVAPDCRRLTNSLYQPSSEEVLAFALERGWLTLPAEESTA